MMDFPQANAEGGPGRVVGPRFCPGCGRIERDETAACRHCGDPLARRGYCGVCETYWLLVPGTPCPKHEVKLEADAPAPPEVFSAARRARLVTVATFADPLGAEAPRIRLESEGIPTFLEGERMGGPSMYQVATGGVKLQVPESLLADARIVLAQSWSPVKLEADDLDEAWDDLDPDAGHPWHEFILA